MTFKNSRKYFFVLVFLPTLASANDIPEINSKLPSLGTGSTVISGPGISNKIVNYQNINGLAIFEADIIIGTVEQAKQRAQLRANTNSGKIFKSVIIADTHYHWPSNIVPYQIDSRVTAKVTSLIKQAIAHWHSNTEVRFVLRTTQNAARFPDYVTIQDNEAACWSYVGRRGGEQKLNIAAVCGVGSTIHEFGHVMGLWHEQSRADRNLYIMINKNNIRKDKENSFEQKFTKGIDIGVYDYGSIMHYGRMAFGKINPVTGDRFETITPIQAGVTIGQRDGLSPLDTAAVLTYYPLQGPITARLNQTRYSANAGKSITFSAGKSSGGGLIYEFDSGDGLVKTVSTPNYNHVYSFPGSYVLTLTITNYLGYTATTYANVTVVAAQGLIADLKIVPFVWRGNSVTADASWSTGTNLRYKFDMGDGKIFVTTQQHVKHLYTRAGIYPVTLTITNARGLSASSSATIEVQ